LAYFRQPIFPPDPNPEFWLYQQTRTNSFIPEIPNGLPHPKHPEDWAYSLIPYPSHRGLSNGATTLGGSPTRGRVFFPETNMSESPQQGGGFFSRANTTKAQGLSFFPNRGPALTLSESPPISPRMGSHILEPITPFLGVLFPHWGTSSKREPNVSNPLYTSQKEHHIIYAKAAPYRGVMGPHKRGIHTKHPQQGRRSKMGGSPPSIQQCCGGACYFHKKRAFQTQVVSPQDWLLHITLFFTRKQRVCPTSNYLLDDMRGPHYIGGSSISNTQEDPPPLTRGGAQTH